jgi:thiol-disulfide isomerase/thioredoxin
MSEGAVMMEPVTIDFYTRSHCPLCDKAKVIMLELKKEWNFIMNEHDIDESDEWTEKYGLMIPVVVMDGEELEYGNVNKLSISKRLQEKSSNI